MFKDKFDDASQLSEKYLSGNAALHMISALILHSLTVKGTVAKLAENSLIHYPLTIQDVDNFVYSSALLKKKKKTA